MSAQPKKHHEQQCVRNKVSSFARANEKRNFTIKVQKFTTDLDIWRSRNLRLFGRVLITESLGIPHLIYSMSMLVTPSEIVSSVTASLFDFIWCKKTVKIKRQAMYQDYVYGGPRVPNMEVMAKSLNAKRPPISV